MIDYQLMDDITDASSITVDGIEFGWIGDFNQIDEPGYQERIHNAINKIVSAVIRYEMKEDG